jgi:GT2 family glycosyltransferase
LTSDLPTVRVVIVHHDTPETLERCLRALLVSDGVQLSVVVVDNATLTASGAEAVRAQGVELILNEENVGFGAACNQGWRAHRESAWTLFLNPDVFVGRRTIADAIAGIGAAAGGGCRLLRPDGSLDPACKRQLPTPASALVRATGLARRFPRLDRYNAAARAPEAVARTDALVGAFMLIRTAALDAVGGFDERFFMYAEDLDLCLRLTRRFGPLVYVGNVTATHVKRASSSAEPHRMRREFFRSMRQYLFKHYPLPLAAPLASATFVWELASRGVGSAAPR